MIIFTEHTRATELQLGIQRERRALVIVLLRFVVDHNGDDGCSGSKNKDNKDDKYPNLTFIGFLVLLDALSCPFLLISVVVIQ